MTEVLKMLKELKTENEALRKDNIFFKGAIEGLTEKNGKMTLIVEGLIKEGITMKDEMKELKATN